MSETIIVDGEVVNNEEAEETATESSLKAKRVCKYVFAAVGIAAVALSLKFIATPSKTEDIEDIEDQNED